MRVFLILLLIGNSLLLFGQGKQHRSVDQAFEEMMYRIGITEMPPVQNSFDREVTVPEKLAQQQLDAYNAGDIDAFLEPYHDEVEIYNFPQELRMKGKAQMRTVYDRLFTDVPDLHCELVNRIVMGDTVIDQEHVTGFPDGQAIDAIAVYKIRDGKIFQVYFIR